MNRTEIINHVIIDNREAAAELGETFTEADENAIRAGRMVAYVTVVMPAYRGHKARVHAMPAWEGGDNRVYWLDVDNRTAVVNVAPNHYRSFMGPEIAKWYGRKFLPSLPVVPNIKLP